MLHAEETQNPNGSHAGFQIEQCGLRDCLGWERLRFPFVLRYLVALPCCVTLFH